ncbi:MAG: type II toxin-antitoxin system PemK/MazF family toxin [Pseudomonadota bacterium]
MRFDRGDLVWLDFNPESGHEQAGRRPALVVSPEAYNARSNCILICPISSNTDPWPWKTALPKGLPVVGAILVDQLTSLDVAARHVEPMAAAVSADVMADVLARLATLTA